MNIITGIPRSGTTLTSRVFQSCGADFGNNCTQLFEDSRIRKITMDYLKSIGADPLGQDPLPQFLIPDYDLHSKVPKLEIIKQCKIILYWEEWVRAFPEAKWVIVRREASEIVDSCLRTSFMRAHKDEDGWYKWIEYHLKCIDSLKQSVDYVEVWPKHFKDNPEYTGMKNAVEFLGYQWDEDKARVNICPSKLR